MFINIFYEYFFFLRWKLDVIFMFVCAIVPKYFIRINIVSSVEKNIVTLIIHCKLMGSFLK